MSKKVEKIKRQARMNNATVGILLTSGGIFLAMSFSGRQTTLIEYCFKPKTFDPASAAQFCTEDKRYLMPAYPWDNSSNQPSNPEFQNGWQLPAKATRLGIIEPDNPYKWLWGLLGVASIGGAYALSKGRERKLTEYLPKYRQRVSESWIRSQIASWIQTRRQVIHAMNVERKLQHAADVDFELFEFATNRLGRRRQFELMSPEEIQVYMERARLRAQLEAQAQAEEATGMKEQGQLPGQSLDQVNDPSDKVTSAENQTLSSDSSPTGESVNSSAAEGDDGGSTDKNTGPPDKWTPYREIGERIIKSMIVSDKSVLVASGTGTGKTTTENYYLRKFREKYPKCKLYALLNKNDKLFGVPERSRYIFKPEQLNELPTGKGVEEERGAIIKHLLEPLFAVYGIYLTRKDLPEDEREQLKLNEPVRLILGDWYGTYQELQARLKDAELQLILSMIRQIITIGRSCGVGLYVDTQSDKLDSLGLANDASIRLSLDIYSQGFIYYEDGEEKGELQTIRLVFKNDSICSAEDRETIATVYSVLCEAIRNGELKTPIIFTTVGAKPRIGIVPKLSGEVDLKDQNVWDSVISTLNKAYLNSEFNINLGDNQNLMPSEEAGDDEEDDSEEKTLEQKIIEYLRGKGEKMPEDMKKLKKFRKWSTPEIRNALNELVKRGTVVSLGKDKYRLA